MLLQYEEKLDENNRCLS